MTRTVVKPRRVAWGEVALPKAADRKRPLLAEAV